MSEVTVRHERADDVAAVRSVVEAAFGSPAEARLVEAIRASEHFIDDLSIVAELAHEVVGHVMISYVGLRTSEGQQRIASLSPLAVAPAHQRQGIGSALVSAVTAAAEERGEPLVVLEGNPEYYSRFRFEHSVPCGITIELPLPIAEDHRNQGKAFVTARKPREGNLRPAANRPGEDGVGPSLRGHESEPGSGR